MLMKMPHPNNPWDEAHWNANYQSPCYNNSDYATHSTPQDSNPLPSFASYPPTPHPYSPPPQYEYAVAPPPPPPHDAYYLHHPHHRSYYLPPQPSSAFHAIHPPPPPPPPPPHVHRTTRGSPPPVVYVPQEKFIMQVRDEDVLCGRGAPSNWHPGNQVFRRLVTQMQPSYLACRRADKPEIAVKIVESIRERGGRFLKRVKQPGVGPSGHFCWQEIGEQRSYEKACQALREGAPEMRRQLAAREAAKAAAASSASTAVSVEGVEDIRDDA